MKMHMIICVWQNFRYIRSVLVAVEPVDADTGRVSIWRVLVAVEPVGADTGGM